MNTDSDTALRLPRGGADPILRSVSLVSTQACHLCEDAHSELLSRATRGQLSLDQVDAESPLGQELLARHRPAMFPLVLLDGQFFSAGRLPRRKLDRALASPKAS